MAFFGYINRHNIVFIAVNGVHGLISRYYRDFVLGRAAAEKDGESGFHLNISLLVYFI